jgi:hypothetical protein
MNTKNIKAYAPKARKQLLTAIVQRLNQFGISADKQGKVVIQEPRISGSTMLIHEKPYDIALQPSVKRLTAKANQLGYSVLTEQLAYIWFNRLCAIRYMEIHDYLEHGLRVLSHPTQSTGFQILDNPQDVADDLGLDRNRLIDLKLANKDEELYRELLLGQCHKLHEYMPFLFEALDDDTELMLPDNLTRTDSILRSLVDDVPEEDWQNVEIIGWLYQFYISEKKDLVIGKVVKSEDIPAATQLFTPNWIVQYLVQNSIGRQWMLTYPDSNLKQQMPYFIPVAEQPAEAQKELDELTPKEINPEAIKVLDPASGSGHILVEAYNTLKHIYEERGYRIREIPKLILENNLYGLDIDNRAAQLAGFALMMKARGDDRRILTREIKLNIMALQQTDHIAIAKQWKALNINNDWQAGTSEQLFDEDQMQIDESDTQYQLFKQTLEAFHQAKTLGSLIDIPHTNLAGLLELKTQLASFTQSSDPQQKNVAIELRPIFEQAILLAQQYDAVIANPPYMGSKYHIKPVKDFLKENYKGFEKDLFSAFIIRNLELTKPNGQLGFMTPFVWMFISSYENLRARLIEKETISTLVQLEYSGFDGATVPICTFTLTKGKILSLKGTYIRLSDFKGSENQGPKTLEAIQAERKRLGV